MAEIIVVETAVDKDLTVFSRYLWQQKMSHRIIQSEGRQLLLVGTEKDAEQVALAYKAYLNGDSVLPEIQPLEQQAFQGFWQNLLTTPVTLGFLLLSIVGYFLVAFDKDFGLVKYLTFFEFERIGAHYVYSIPEGEYWRLFTPIFLHFNVLHIVFNTLWLWDLGRRVELLQGSERMLGILMVMGLGSNITQFVYAQAGVFGGMSGVIYGLLGYGWMWGMLCPERSLGIPRPIFYFMLGWLVFCMMGFATLLGAGEVANAAHVGGLIMGMILGVGAGVIAKLSTEK